MKQDKTTQAGAISNPSWWHEMEPLYKLSVADLDKPIYRFISLTRLLEMFKTRQLILPKVISWEDPYENFFLKSKFKTTDQSKIAHLQDSFFGLCWSLSANSDALWMIKSSDKRGVRIKTTIGKLLNVFNASNYNFVIGKVEYISKKEMMAWWKSQKTVSISQELQDKTIKALFYKRDNFSHEREIRVISCCPQEAHESLIKINNIDCKDFIDNIRFDSRVDLNYKRENRNDISQKYGYPQERIKKSTLYDFHPVTISLTD